MLVIGLFIGGGLVSIGPIIDKTHWNQTNTTLDQIENALVLFAIRNNRLPCPADGSIGAGAGGNYGKEQITTGAGKGVTRTCTVATTNSVIPWITLGLDETYSVDGWGRRISYLPASATLNTSVDALVDDDNGSAGLTCQSTSCTLCLSRTTAPSGSSTRYKECDNLATPSTPFSPSYPWGSFVPIYAVGSTTELTSPQPLTTCGSGGGSDASITASNVGCAGGRAAYVLISHGTSGWYGWTKSSSTTANQIQPAVASTNKSYNNAGTAPNGTGPGFYQGTPIGTVGSANYFDDIVRWRTPAMIIQLCGSGACGNP